MSRKKDKQAQPDKKDEAPGLSVSKIQQVLRGSIPSADEVAIRLNRVFESPDVNAPVRPK
jgi:hypothetical protein